ncbi:MAG: class II aldolase/adducin family protein [Terracidiphilus sp.]
MPNHSNKSTKQPDLALIESVVRRAFLECAGQSAPQPGASNDPHELFHSPAVMAIKKEIVRAGKKLWKRQYVDGNGGNISVRVSNEYVVCSPTLLSKGDVRVEDLALVDLDNRRVCGHRSHTSELLLHLEIYKTVPQAKAVIHCHPPYATAHAVAGVIPQGNLVPEQEVFIGPVALSPYETPGTPEFARTVRPLAKDHNTILLANHGVVCWADTVTHAEWYVEIIDTYCKTIMIASQLRPKLKEIAPDKIADLVAMKQRLGMSLPDPRYAKVKVVEPEKLEATINAYIGAATPEQLPSKSNLDASEMDQIVRHLSLEIAAFLEKKR